MDCGCHSQPFNHPHSVGPLPPPLPIAPPCEKPVLFHAVTIPANVGDDTEYPATSFNYANVILTYEANGHVYIYSSDHIPTLVSNGAASTEELEEQLKQFGVRLDADEATILENKEQIQAAQEELANLKADVEQLDEKVNQATGDVSALQEQVNTNTADIAKNTTAINDVTTLANGTKQELDGLSTLVGEVETDVTKNSSDIQQLKTDLATETQEREDETSQLQQLVGNNTTAISTINATLNQTVEQSTEFTSNDSTVEVVHSKVNLSNNEKSETTDALPVASTTQAGIINAATFSSIGESAELVDSILNGAVAINGLSATLTQAELTTAWKSATSETELINRASIFDQTNGKIWYYYSNTNMWYSVGAEGGSGVTVSQATNTSLGIVKGSELDGQSFAESDGTLSVNGWDTVKSDIANLKSSMEVEDTRTKNLPTQVVYKTSLPEYKENEVDLTLVLKDLHTGGDASTPLNIMGATTAKAGVMTASQVSTLEYLDSQMSTTMSDVDDALGDIAAIQADYISKTNIKTINGESLVGTGDITVPKLYNNYGTNTDGALTQAFVSEKLNSSNLVLGNGAQAGTDSLAPNVAVGPNAVAVGPNAVAVGPNADSQYQGSVALGLGAKTRKAYEVALADTASSSVHKKELTGLAYPTTPSSAVTKELFDSRLDGMDVYIGQNVNEIGRAEVIIGRLASGTGKDNCYGVAIGTNSAATSQSRVPHRFAVALGAGARVARDNEVSIGYGAADPVPIWTVPTRYLANVTAGELDTDAVNVKQLNDTIGAKIEPINTAIGEANARLETLVSGAGV